MSPLSSRVAFEPVIHLAVVVLAAVALLALLALGPARGRLSPKRRFALIGLRLFVIVLVLVMMLRPTIVYRGYKRQTATLAVLLDVSRSLQVSDDDLSASDEDRKSRWKVMQEMLEGSSGDLREMSELLELKFYSFDTQLKPLVFDKGKVALPSSPDGDQTAIGFALSELMVREAGKRLVGVVLITDGNQQALAPYDREPHLAARQYKDICPIHTVPIGKPDSQSQIRDLVIERLLVNKTVFEKNQLPVEVHVRFSGFVNQRVPVELLFETSPGKMEVVQTAHLQAAADGQVLPLAMTYVPTQAGQRKLTVRVARQPGELLDINNEESTFVTVKKGGIRVLYLEGNLRVEQKFLRKAIDASEDINVDYLRLDADRAHQRPESVTTALAEAFQKGKYDVFILGDLDSRAFRAEELQALAQTVKDGAGLVMLGGFRSFGPGGYARTPLADVIPVRMDDTERQNFTDTDRAIRTDVHIPGPIRLRPGRLAGPHFLTLLAPPEKNASFWLSLPPLDGANKFRGLKDATVLLESSDGAPILAAGNTPGGRVLGFAGDSTWRWWTNGYEAAHKRFWRQVVLWLAFKDDAQEGNVWVNVDPHKLRKGLAVEIAAGANSPQGEPLADATFEAEMVFPPAKDDKPGTLPRRQKVELAGQGEKRTLTFRDTSLPGDYKIVVRASHGGQLIGTAEGRFIVFDQDLELERPVADVLAMQRLSDMTPGALSVPPERFGELIEHLRKLPRELQVPVETKTTLWDRWWLFAILALAAALEWFLRKRWGLV